MNVADELRAARKASGLTQAEAGERARVSRQVVNALEQGRGTISNFHLVAAAVEMRIAGLPSGKTLGDRIKLARERRRWTQSTLAARSGVSVPTIRNLERNVGQIGSLRAALAVLGRDIRRRKNEQACWESGRRDVRFTPKWLLDEIVSALGPISLDPCSAEGSHVQAARYIFEEEDGLKTRWSGQLAFCNPPFSQAGKWLDRCYRAWVENEADVVVALVPVRTSTRVFHDRCAGIADVLFLPGRPDFMNPFAPPGTSGHTPFGVMAICWGASPDAVRVLSEKLGARLMPRDVVKMAPQLPNAYPEQDAQYHRQKPGCHPEHENFRPFRATDSHYDRERNEQ